MFRHYALAIVAAGCLGAAAVMAQSPAPEALCRIYTFKGWQQESAFYVDTAGVVRYQLNGSESHGDSMGRVAWSIDQLKQLTR